MGLAKFQSQLKCSNYYQPSSNTQHSRSRNSRSMSSTFSGLASVKVIPLRNSLSHKWRKTSLGVVLWPLIRLKLLQLPQVLTRSKIHTQAAIIISIPWRIDNKHTTIIRRCRLTRRTNTQSPVSVIFRDSRNSSNSSKCFYKGCYMLRRTDIVTSSTTTEIQTMKTLKFKPR